MTGKKTCPHGYRFWCMCNAHNTYMGNAKSSTVVELAHSLTITPIQGSVDISFSLTASWYFLWERMSDWEGLASETGWLWYHPTTWSSFSSIAFWICRERERRKGERVRERRKGKRAIVCDSVGNGRPKHKRTFISAFVHCSASLASHRHGNAWHTSKPVQTCQQHIHSHKQTVQLFLVHVSFRCFSVNINKSRSLY